MPSVRPPSLRRNNRSGICPTAITPLQQRQIQLPKLGFASNHIRQFTFDHKPHARHNNIRKSASQPILIFKLYAYVPLGISISCGDPPKHSLLKRDASLRRCVLRPEDQFPRAKPRPAKPNDYSVHFFAATNAGLFASLGSAVGFANASSQRFRAASIEKSIFRSMPPSYRKNPSGARAIASLSQTPSYRIYLHLAFAPFLRRRLPTPSLACPPNHTGLPLRAAHARKMKLKTPFLHFHRIRFTPPNQPYSIPSLCFSWFCCDSGASH